MYVVYVYTSMYVYRGTAVCIYVLMYIHMYVYMYICVYICMMYVCRLCMHICMMYVCKLCMHVYMHSFNEEASLTLHARSIRHHQ